MNELERLVYGTEFGDKTVNAVIDKCRALYGLTKNIDVVNLELRMFVKIYSLDKEYMSKIQEFIISLQHSDDKQNINNNGK